MTTTSKKFGIGRILLAFLCVLVALVALAAWWAVGTKLPRLSTLSVEATPGEKARAPKATLTFVTYNMAHGQGIKVKPTDWRNEAYTRQKLAELSVAIKTMDADVVFLQEVDLDSHRTYHINQPEWIAKSADYPYSACALVWDKNYLPFPFLPVKQHLGQMRAANCILSRYPLSEHSRLVFDKPEANAFWYNWGYIDRAAQHVVMRVGNKPITLVNIHLEAYDKETREKQARELDTWLRDMPGPLVLGGDFNAIPKDAVQRTGFEDEPEDDYTGDTTVETVRQALDQPHEAVPANDFTFPADKPTRRLDYLFATKGASVIQGRVANEAGVASDHLPVWAEIQF